MAEIDENKYTIAIVIVTIFICASIITWVIRMYKEKEDEDKNTIPFPPYKSPCPDFWESKGVNADGTHQCKPLIAVNKDTAGPGGKTAGMNGVSECDGSTNTAVVYDMDANKTYDSDSTSGANSYVDFCLLYTSPSPRD